jgi:hypothetical protein
MENIVDYILKMQNEALDQDKKASRFCATDENGNEVLGSVNIEGKLDIGLIRGVEKRE